MNSTSYREHSDYKPRPSAIELVAKIKLRPKNVWSKSRKK